jgi:hypothetical protein
MAIQVRVVVQFDDTVEGLQARQAFQEAAEGMDWVEGAALIEYTEDEVSDE